MLPGVTRPRGVHEDGLLIWKEVEKEKIHHESYENHPRANNTTEVWDKSRLRGRIWLQSEVGHTPGPIDPKWGATMWSRYVRSMSFSLSLFFNFDHNK